MPTDLSFRFIGNSCFRCGIVHDAGRESEVLDEDRKWLFLRKAFREKKWVFQIMGLPDNINLPLPLPLHLEVK